MIINNLKGNYRQGNDKPRIQKNDPSNGGDELGGWDVGKPYGKL